MDTAEASALEHLTHRLLDAAKAAGAEAADAIAVASTSVSVGVRARALEDAERSEAFDLGLRVLIGRRQACVSSSDRSDATLVEMAERAVAMAREAPDDPHAGLADAGALAQDWSLATLDLEDRGVAPDPAALETRARACEDAAAALPGISQVDAANAAYSRRQVHLAATNGFSGGYARTGHGLSCVAITGTGTGMERDYHGEMCLHAEDLSSPEEIGRLAAERALARAGARQPRTGRYPVLFDERVASSLIGHLVQAASGSAVARGASWLSDARGARVLPSGIDLVDDALRPRGPASRPFDAEGLPGRTRRIVEDGVLTGWTLDLATARKLGMESTGSAARGPSAPPQPSVCNLTLTQGTASRDDLIAQMGTGLLVTSMIGATINPTTGDYSRGAAGLWIENGEIAYPVNECTLAGNLRDMLMTIVPANDARPKVSRVVPSLLVDGLTLAGA